MCITDHKIEIWNEILFLGVLNVHLYERLLIVQVGMMKGYHQGQHYEAFREKLIFLFLEV